MTLAKLLVNFPLIFASLTTAVTASETADIYAASEGVRLYAVDAAAGTTLVNSSNAELTYGIAYDAPTETLFWSSARLIYRANVRDPTNFTDISHTTEYGYIQGLAMDDTTGDLYGAGETGYIFVCKGARTSNTPACSIVFHDNGTHYGGLALSTKDRIIYYTRNAGIYGPGEIRRVGMDGSDPTLVLQTGTNVVAGLALDAAASRLYWAEHYPGLIQSCGLDGANPELVGWFGYTHGIAVTSDRVYWTNPTSGWLTSSLKDGGDARLEHFFGGEIYHIVAVNRTG